MSNLLSLEKEEFNLDMFASLPQALQSTILRRPLSSLKTGNISKLE